MFKKQNQKFLSRLDKIHQNFKSLIESDQKSSHKSPQKIQQKIDQLKGELILLKEKNAKNQALLDASIKQSEHSLEDKVKELEASVNLKKEAKALDQAINKVSRAEKLVECAIDKTKVEIVNAQLACLEAIKAKAELDEVVHQ